MAPSSKDNEEEKLIFNPNLNADDSFSEHIPAPSPPHSHYSSTIQQIPIQQNGENTSLSNGIPFGSKHQSSAASKYYARHRHLLKTNNSASETSLPKNESIPQPTLNTIRQE